MFFKSNTCIVYSSVFHSLRLCQHIVHECNAHFMAVNMGCIPLCATWPVASHPDWSVCKPWFYNGTKTETEKREGKQGVNLSTEGLCPQFSQLLA